MGWHTGTAEPATRVVRWSALAAALAVGLLTLVVVWLDRYDFESLSAQQPCGDPLWATVMIPYALLAFVAGPVLFVFGIVREVLRRDWSGAPLSLLGLIMFVSAFPTFHLATRVLDIALCD